MRQGGVVTAQHTHTLIIACDRKLSQRCLRRRQYTYSTLHDCRHAAGNDGWEVYGGEAGRESHICAVCRRQEQAKVARGGNGAAAP